MDVFQSLANMVIPRWVKAVVVIILVGLMVINVLLGYFGLAGNVGDESWVAAAASLLGVLLPILLIAFVLMYSDGGTKGLRIKTYHYMTQIIPETLVSMVEEPGPYYLPRKDKGKPIESKVQIHTNQYKKSCIGSYIIKFPGRLINAAEMKRKGKNAAADNHDGASRTQNTMHVSLELNVRKANLSVYVPARQAELDAGLISKVDEFDSGAAKRPFTFANFQKLFPHTMEGCRSEGYKNNETLRYKKIGDCYYYGVVFIKDLGAQFLTKPQEKLYFAQDMMFMLKGFYNECPDLFFDECSGNITS